MDSAAASWGTTETLTSDQDTGPAGVTAEPIWADVSHIRDEMMWDRLDHALTTRAAARLMGALGWMILAVTCGGQFGWGVAMLLGTALSVLHAHRRIVLAIVDAAGPASGFVRWLLPYPRSPHTNPCGVIETLGLGIAVLGTGWVGDAFGSTPTAHAAAPAATVMVLIVAAGVTGNFTGHMSWEFEEGPLFYRRIRLFIGPAIAIFLVMFLWPSPDLGAANAAVLAVTVGGGLAIAVLGWTAQAMVSEEARLVRDRSSQLRAAVQQVDAHQVHQIKNIARVLYDRAEEITEPGLREAAKRLSLAVSSTEKLLKAGRGLPARCVEDLVDGLIGLDDKAADVCVVEADLDPRDLAPGDADLLMIAVTNLTSNALRAHATVFRVGLTAEPTMQGSCLRLHAACSCGRTLTDSDMSKDSSLMRLAVLLERTGGSFVVTDDARGTHEFLLEWPTLSRPRPRQPRRLVQSPPTRVAAQEDTRQAAVEVVR